MALPRLTEKQILVWARAHRKQAGEWPRLGSGAIAGTAERWSAIQAALYRGARGLKGGMTLARLLAHA